MKTWLACFTLIKKKEESYSECGIIQLSNEGHGEFRMNVFGSFKSHWSCIIHFKKMHSTKFIVLLEQKYARKEIKE